MVNYDDLCKEEIAFQVKAVSRKFACKFTKIFPVFSEAE